MHAFRRFPSAGHLASWCGLCPGNAESAGKRHSGRTGKGNTYLRRALVEAAWAASRINHRRTFFTTLFFRISRRTGLKNGSQVSSLSLRRYSVTVSRRKSTMRRLAPYLRINCSESTAASTKGPPNNGQWA